MDTENYIETLMTWFAIGWDWVLLNVLQPERLLEFAIVIVAFLVSSYSCRWVHNRILDVAGDHPIIKKTGKRYLLSVMKAVMALVLIWTGEQIWPGESFVLTTASSLLLAWVAIRFATLVVVNREIARFIAVVFWTIAAANIVGILAPLMAVLEGIALPLGDEGISVLDIFKGLLTFSLFMWGALALASFIERRLKKMSAVPPSAMVLISKTSRIALISMAFFIALNSTGIDLTAFAVFGGALGVGIGFGLQKVVGNFISGIILVMDRSIKPGDVIQMTDAYGTINKMAARYTSVITRDGTEYLIPNESLITEPVINWTHTDQLVRQKIPVQISYGSDLKLAMKLMEESASKSLRVLRHPAPVVLLKGFNSDGVDLELRMWIGDPHNGVSNISSEVMMNIWDEFHAHDIEFPFPQRVLHIKKEDAGDIDAGDLFDDKDK